MDSAKQTMKDTASATKEHVDNYPAKAEEKVEKSTARTEEEKQIAEPEERRKVKEAEGKVNLHQDKAEHVAEELDGKHAEYFPAAYPPSGTGYRTSHHF